MKIHILNYLQCFIISQPDQFTPYLSNIFTKILVKYFISLCNFNKELSSFKVSDIYNSIDIIPEVVNFIKK